jgi:hypothetical protein
LVTNILVVLFIINLWAVSTYLVQGLVTFFYKGLAYFFHLVVTFRTKSTDKSVD